MTLTTIQIGETINSIKLPPVSRIDLIKYAGASGDFNPIHTIDDEAKSTGLPGVIAHGMWTMGNLGKLFRDYYDTDFEIGGNEYAYKDIVPHNEVWIEKSVDKEDRVFILYHELFESNLMKQGYSYAAAHKAANKFENQKRQEAKGEQNV